MNNLQQKKNDRGCVGWNNSGEKVEKRMIWVVESDGGSVKGVLEVECKSDGGGGGARRARHLAAAAE